MRSIPVPRVVVGVLALLLASAAAEPGLVAGDTVAGNAGAADR